MKITFWLCLGTCLLLLCLSFSLSMSLGVVNFSPLTVYQAFTAFDGSTAHLIIRTIRLPRSLICLVLGSALAVAGGLIQGITRNPLASPGILGINSGAALAVVLTTIYRKESGLNLLAISALCGATLAVLTVYWFAGLGRGGVSSLNLILAGAAVTAFTSSLTSGLLILNQRSLEEIRFWLAGSLAGRNLDLLGLVLPYLLIGLCLGLILSKQVTLLSLGDEIALSLGQNTILIKLLVALAIILLAGGSVAMAGPLGFIGLIVPHLVRLLVGNDYGWILPWCMVVGSTLLLLADTLARLLIPPQEVPVGLILPILGTPLFIYLVRQKLR